MYMFIRLASLGGRPQAHVHIMHIIIITCIILTETELAEIMMAVIRGMMECFIEL